MVPFFTLSRHPEQFPNPFRDFFFLCGQKQTYDNTGWSKLSEQKLRFFSRVKIKKNAFNKK
jgi:hypothetical protein